MYTITDIPHKYAVYMLRFENLDSSLATTEMDLEVHGRTKTPGEPLVIWSLCDWMNFVVLSNIGQDELQLLRSKIATRTMMLLAYGRLKERRKDWKTWRIPRIFSMREWHEGRASCHKSYTTTNLATRCFLGSIIVGVGFVLRRGAESERLKSFGVWINIIIVVDWVRMNSNLDAHRKMETIGHRDTLFRNDFLQNTSAHKSPKTHALAKATIQTRHTSQDLLRPYTI